MSVHCCCGQNEGLRGTLVSPHYSREHGDVPTLNWMHFKYMPTPGRELECSPGPAVIMYTTWLSTTC